MRSPAKPLEPTLARSEFIARVPALIDAADPMLFLGLCLVLSAGAFNLASARSTTAFNSFKVWMSSKREFKSTYPSLTESFGAVVNQCAFPVSLLFDVPVDNAGSHTFTVQNYFKGTDGENTFSCQSYAYNGSGGITPGSKISFTASGQSLQTSVTAADDESAQVICTDIPAVVVSRTSIGIRANRVRACPPIVSMGG